MGRRFVVRTSALVASAVLVALTVAPSAVADAAPQPVPAAACWQRSYTDPQGDAVPDIAAYSLSFDCATSRFTLALALAPGPTFPYVLGDNLRMGISTSSGGGCQDMTHMVLGRREVGGSLSAVVYRTPTCSTSTWTLIGTGAFVSRDSGHTLLLAFDAATIGTATFRWTAQSAVHASGSNADRVPDSGWLLASGVPYYPGATSGYWLADAGGGVHPYGLASSFGDLQGVSLAAPIVGMAAVPNRSGYWLLGRDGGVFSYGSARFYGSTGNIHLNQPIVGLSATQTGLGYWFVASDGGVFSYGDAPFFGSTGAIRLNRPIVGMAPTKSGRGYWLVASDGGIFSFGDARFFGSTGNLRLARPIVGMTVSPSGNGYRFAASDGGIFSFGDAPFYGSLAGTPTSPVVGIS